jgi:hypothetical protein
MATTLHVDDGILAVPSHAHAERFFGAEDLGKKHKITWEPLRHTLGIDFDVSYTPRRRRVFMSQRPFCITILERAGLLDCNPAKTPAVHGRRYTKDDSPSSPRPTV